MNMQFTNNLRAARLSSGLTQRELAEKLGVVPSCYANWEQGRTQPDLSALCRIVKILDLSFDELFEFDEISSRPISEKAPLSYEKISKTELSDNEKELLENFNLLPKNLQLLALKTLKVWAKG